MQRVAKILLDRGLVSARDIAEAEAAQGDSSAFLGATLVRIGAISESGLIAALSEALNIPILADADAPSSTAVVEAVSRLAVDGVWLIEREAAIWFVGEALHVAGRAVHEAALMEAAQQWTSGPIKLFYARSAALAPVWQVLAQTGRVDLRDAKSLRELAEEAPVIDFVNQILAEARARDASDIHVEPFEDHMAIRLRIDGVLVLWRTAPRAQFEAVSSRIKLLSGIDIAERRLPQDGRQRIRAGGQDIDLRVSTLPTRWGESVVLRVLGNTRDLPDFDGLGLAGDHQALLHSMMQRTNGVILVTGPTGSGKTTTVYRILSALNDGARKIVTVEDPVEMNLPGVMQMQANSDIGLDFAAGLRAMLRQDPDVIFVGEIRDVETARTAVQAALTGHLVISTVHTNSALSAVWRLMDLGVEPFLVAEAVSGVVAQRLIRRLCSHCAAPDPGAEDAPARQRLGRWVQGVAPQWRKATGCARCAGQGLKGRIGVYEMIAIDATLRDAIRTRASEQTLREIAANHGMRFLGEDALMKARAGLCSSADAQKLSV